MNVIEYEYVQVKDGFEGFALSECKVVTERNAHAVARITLVAKEGTGFEDVQKGAGNKKISLLDSKNNEVLFAGKIQRMETCVSGTDQKLIILAGSYSIELDDEKVSRSFQNVAMTYQELVEQVVEGEATILCSKECQKAIGRIYVQYQETNWDFLIRIAGELGLSLFADVTKDRPVVYLGAREMEVKTEFDPYEYSHGISPFYHTSKEEECFGKADFVYYDVESYENYEIGAKTTYRGETFWICKKAFRLDKGQICFSYRIAKRGLLFTRKCVNESLRGASLSGKVLATENETLKIHLDIDQKQDQGTAFQFQWTPLSGNMMYCMPQKGTKVNLYFADGEESSAKAVSCVGGEKEDISSGQGSSFRAFTSEHGKRMELTPDSVRFSNGGADDGEKDEIVLKDNDGIMFSSQHQINICARGEVTIEGKSDSVSGVTAVQLMQTGVPVTEDSIQNPVADIEIAGNEDYFGDNVYVESHGERMSCPPFDDEPEEGEFDWGGLLKNVLVGLVVAVAVAATVAAVAVTCGAAAPFGAIFLAGVIGGAVGVGCLAYSDIKSGNVSETGRYALKGFTGALSGSLTVACGPTAMTGHFWKYVGQCALTGVWTSALGNGIEQIVENSVYGDEMSLGEFICSSLAGGFFSGVAGAFSYGISSLSKTFDFSNMTDRALKRFIASEGGVTTRHFDRAIAKIAGMEFPTEDLALQWARENARSMIMGMQGPIAARAALQTAGVEISSSNLAANASTDPLTEFFDFLFGSGEADSTSSVAIARKYIAQLGY